MKLVPAPGETVLYKICRDGEDDSPLTEAMPLEAHQALINLLLRDRKSSVEDKALRHFNVNY